MESRNEADARYLLLGLPEAGKTTFLAALWHVVDSGEVEGALRVASYTENVEHLNAIRDRWLAVDPTPRTRQVSEKQVRILLRAPDEGTVEVVLPDMSGETFVQHWKERKWPQRYADLVASSAGVLLLVHPGHVYPAPRLDEVLETLRELTDAQRLDSAEDLRELPSAPSLEEPATSAESAHEQAEETSWDPERAPTEVILVDILQMILSTRMERTRLKVALIISAWDMLESGRATLEGWISQHLPFLEQFLSANDDLLEWKPFGVSAHGGDPLKDAATLRKVRKPHDRIRVVGGEGSLHDITWPLRWLLM